MNNQSTIYNNSLQRSGFSIIEVMTSIVVAMIGVFGVMVLIPFAVKQAQTGLDSDAATVVARNAYDQFEIAGYRNSETWVVDVVPPNYITAPVFEKFKDDTAIANGDLPPGPQPYSIDPLGVTEQFAGSNYATTDFPFNHIKAGATDFPVTGNGSLVIQSANLLLPNQQPMRKSDARRMFRAADDLVFANADEGAAAGTEDAKLNGPEQVFDRGGTPTIALKRQSLGKISWSAIVVPENISGSSYKMYILVYKTRSTETTIKGPEFQMITAKVDLPNLPPPAAGTPVSTIQLEPGFEIPNGEVRKDEWVMLTNRRGPRGIDQQIAFYRVVNYDPGSVAANLPVQLTLDGPDFNFDTTVFGPTHVVHLKNVVGVYERTFSPEGNSTWNIAF